MGVRIDADRCNGCGACVDICPGDLLVLRGDQAVLRTADQCWHCLSCAKACPLGAIRGWLPFSLADAGAALWPVNEGDRLRWICEDADGRREEFLQTRGDGG